MRKIVMPEVGNPAVKLTVFRWFKAVGDAVAKGDVLARVEGDSGPADLDAAAGGVLSAILVKAGQSVTSGTVIAEMEDAVDEDPKTERRTQKEETMASVEASRAVEVVPVLMPQAGNSMEEGTIVKWHVKEGDRVKKGQVILEIETDKANMEVEASADGRIAKIVTPEGGVQKVKEAVAYLGEGEVVEEKPKAESRTQKEEVVAVSAVSSESSVSVVSISSDGRVKASPAARRIAAEQGLDLRSVGVGSGPGGRILTNDLAKASAGIPVAALAPKPVPPATPAGPAVSPEVAVGASTNIVRKKMSKMRKAIAANLSQSKQTIPHFYLRGTINADAMMAFYKAEKAKYPCSVNDVVVLALSRAMMEFGAFRSRIEGEEIVEYPNANIGIAVGVDDGLTVPVLLGANKQNLQQIAANSKRIAENARKGKLEGWGEGNFTVTNLGMFGTEEFSAIVNPPEPGILAVGAAREAVIVKDGAMKAGRVMTMTLSCDHRIIDGMLAAKFMARMKELLENPGLLVG